MSAITLIQGDLEKLPVDDLYLLADYYNISKRTDNLTNALSKVFLQKCLHAYMIDPELLKRLEELAITEEAAKKELEAEGVMDTIEESDSDDDEYIREQQRIDAAEYGMADDDDYVEYGNYEDDEDGYGGGDGSSVVDEYEMDVDYAPVEKRQKVIGVQKRSAFPSVTIYSPF